MRSNKYLQLEDIIHLTSKIKDQLAGILMRGENFYKNDDQNDDFLLIIDSNFYQYNHSQIYDGQSDENFYRAIFVHDEGQSNSETFEQKNCQIDFIKRSIQKNEEIEAQMQKHDEVLSSHVTKLEKTKRQHLKLKRNRGPKTQLQRKVKGYWTKNFLQFGKKAHFVYLKNKCFSISKSQNRILSLINKKSGISMRDYEIMYNMKGLQHIWQEFFSTKYLYRSLMISRVENNYRLVFVKFMKVYEKSFKFKRFEAISWIDKND